MAITPKNNDHKEPKLCDFSYIKGAEANLYTFREYPVPEGIQICFRTL